MLFRSGITCELCYKRRGTHGPLEQHKEGLSRLIGSQMEGSSIGYKIGKISLAEMSLHAFRVVDLNLTFVIPMIQILM